MENLLILDMVTRFGPAIYTNKFLELIVLEGNDNKSNRILRMNITHIIQAQQKNNLNHNKHKSCNRSNMSKRPYERKIKKSIKFLNKKDNDDFHLFDEILKLTIYLQTFLVMKITKLKFSFSFYNMRAPFRWAKLWKCFSNCCLSFY